MSIQWSLVLFTALSGCGAWLFVCTALGELRGEIKKMPLLASVISIVLMIAGGIMSATHLSHVDRIFAVLTHPAPGIFLEALLLGITVVDVFVYLMLVKREASVAARKITAAIGLALGLVLVFSCGASYMMDARPAWSTVLLPLSYAGTSAAAGAGLYLLVAVLRGEDKQALSSGACYVLAGGALALLSGLAYGLTSEIAFGSEALLFWAGVVVIGGVVPMVGGALVLKRTAAAAMWGGVALAAGLIGSITMRALMWVVGTPILDYFEVVL